MCHIPEENLLASNTLSAVFMTQVALPWVGLVAAVRGVDFLKLLVLGYLPARLQQQVPEIALGLAAVFSIGAAVVARCDQAPFWSDIVSMYALLVLGYLPACSSRSLRLPWNWQLCSP